MHEPIVYICNVDVQTDVQRLTEFIRKEKCERILHSDKKGNVILIGEMLMLYALKDNFFKSVKDISFYQNEYGKPYVNCSDKAFFNISHSGNIAVCAVFDNEVGADIQKLSKYNEALAKRMCNEDEFNSIIKSENKDYEFTRIWTIKESYQKFLGRGIEYPKFPKKYDCMFKTYNLGDFVLTVAYN